MLINEVEHIVGLSKKSIRLYEENGLLSPSRNKENDYRVYNEEDIKKLRTIKFLRELGVPIKEIKDLQDGNLSLSDCMKDRIDKINIEEEKFKKVKEMCKEISLKDESFHDIDITKYSLAMNILGKEGFTLRDVKTKKMSKITGAVLSSVIFGALFIFIPSIITYFQFTEEEKMPWVLFWFVIVVFAIPFIGIIINLVKRIKEINGGEEDEASKY